MPNHMPQQTLFQFRVPHNFRYPPANPSTWPMPPATHGVLALLRTLASFSTGLASSTRSKSASLRPPAFQRAALTPMYTKHVSQTAHPLRLCHSPTPLVVIGLHYPHRRVPLLLLVFTILIAGCPYCYWSSLSSCCYWSSLSSSQGAPIVIGLHYPLVVIGLHYPHRRVPLPTPASAAGPRHPVWPPDASSRSSACRSAPSSPARVQRLPRAGPGQHG